MGDLEEANSFKLAASAERDEDKKKIIELTQDLERASNMLTTISSEKDLEIDEAKRKISSLVEDLNAVVKAKNESNAELRATKEKLESTSAKLADANSAMEANSDNDTILDKKRGFKLEKRT